MQRAVAYPHNRCQGPARTVGSEAIVSACRRFDSRPGWRVADYGLLSLAQLCPFEAPRPRPLGCARLARTDALGELSHADLRICRQVRPNALPAS
jgi:hypothetical protein